VGHLDVSISNLKLIHWLLQAQFHSRTNTCPSISRKHCYRRRSPDTSRHRFWCPSSSSSPSLFTQRRYPQRSLLDHLERHRWISSSDPMRNRRQHPSAPHQHSTKRRLQDQERSMLGHLQRYVRRPSRTLSDPLPRVSRSHQTAL
jgi:hypothetical protein